MPFGLNPTMTLVANCLPPLGTHDFMRLTSVEEWGFCEFATSVNVGIGPIPAPHAATSTSQSTWPKPDLSRCRLSLDMEGRTFTQHC
jgi:hypothetical protein